jgi:outer membrane protein assembly factor BamB
MSSFKGNVLVYLIVVVLIFGVLGVTIVSLFTTATSSSATPNNLRRAFFMAESGIRYAMSELRNSNFDDDTINDLNSLTYTVNKGGSFNLNVFGSWFKSQAEYDAPAQVILDAAIGEIPNDFSTSPSNMFIVNFDFVGTQPPPSGVALITDIPNKTANSITVDIGGDFVANTDELICFAVNPVSDPPSLNSGDSIFVPLGADDYFPERNGAIYINGNYYFYETKEPDAANNRVELTNLSQLLTASGFPFDMAANEYVILAPANYSIIADGESETDNITFGDQQDYFLNINDLGYPVVGKANPHISFENTNLETDYTQLELSTNPNFIQADDTNKTISIGGGSGQDDFGGIWYSESKSIGGTRNFCTGGRCLFGEGIRVFFVLNFQNQGDGITFSLINGTNNNDSSIGGDIELSELLAYAGDSRTVADGSDYLDGAGNGLQPPKIAIEFDTRTNNDSLDYCSDPTAIIENTRNDPLSGNKDAVQYVFWGRIDSLNIPCRGNSPLYDDNRHDPEGDVTAYWLPFDTFGTVRSSPAINPDEGAVYVGSGALFDNSIGGLYARNLDDGSAIWTFTPQDPNGTGDINVDSSPVVDANGNIYIGSDDGFLYAINKDGNEIWRFFTTAQVESRPAISESRQTVYVEAESRFLYAINTTNGLEQWRLVDEFGMLPDDNELESSPTVGADGTPNDGMIYVGSKDGNLYAVDLDEREANPEGTNYPVSGSEWSFNTGAAVRSTPALDPNDGTIYVGSDNGNVYAIKPDGTSKGAPWPFSTSGPVKSSPAIDTDGNIYVGSDDGHLYKIDQSGSEVWRFPSAASGLSIGEVRSSPAIDNSNGTIYVGSNDGNVYAINPDGTEKWNFPTGGPVISSPAIGPGGNIYVGSNDGLLYAINQFPEPRNFKDENRTLNKLLTNEELGPSPPLDIADTNDWLNGDASDQKPWAVRLEVERKEVTPGSGRFSYNLSLWMRQCVDIDCSNILSTVFEDTRSDYNVVFNGDAGLPKLPMTQNFELDEINPPFNGNSPNPIFERFLFGFTSAVDSSQTQNVTIRKFQLSFISSTDRSVDTDILWNTELGL